MMLVVGAPYKGRLFSIGKGAIGSYSVSPDLPPGLTLDTVTGIILGNPEAAQKRADYVVRAKNAFGTTAAKVNILVLEVLTLDRYTDASPVYVAGIAAPLKP